MKQLPNDPELYRSAYRDQIDLIPLSADYVAYDSIKTLKAANACLYWAYLNPESIPSWLEAFGKMH
ncbi:MAG TPA: hypothetical protein VK957_11465 [Lunatimonas sp.]|nr:hypothetical protein [Lunatimonas sp.]